MAELYGIPSREVDGVWEAVRPWIAAACTRGIGTGYTEEDIHHYLLNREMQMWVVREGAEVLGVGVTEIVERPRRKVCSVVIMAGKHREEWQHFRHTIEAWAREKGCNAMSSWARPGWARVFNDYKQTHVLLEKEL